MSHDEDLLPLCTYINKLVVYGYLQEILVYLRCWRTEEVDRREGNNMECLPVRH